MNNVTILGRMTRQAELRYTQSGIAVARLTLAVDRNLSKSKKQEFEAQGKQTADFINCTIWGKGAEVISEYTEKGSRLAANGRIESGQYQDKNGNTVYTTDVNIKDFNIIDFKSGDDSMFDEVDEAIPF